MRHCPPRPVPLTRPLSTVAPETRRVIHGGTANRSKRFMSNVQDLHRRHVWCAGAAYARQRQRPERPTTTMRLNFEPITEGRFSAGNRKWGGENRRVRARARRKQGSNNGDNTGKVEWHAGERAQSVGNAVGG